MAFNRKFKILWNIFLPLAILSSNFVYGGQNIEQKKQIEEPEEDVSWIRSKAYRIFGGSHYMKNCNYPILDSIFYYTPLVGLDVPLKIGIEKNEGADSTGWVPIPVGDSCTYFRAEYHFKNLNISLEEMVDKHLDFYRQKGISKKYKEEERKQIIEKAKIHIVLFPIKDFELKYHPGSSLLIQQDGSQYGKRLEEPRGGVALKRSYYRLNKEEQANLVGIFNGTFDNEDGIRYVNGERRLPGLILEKKVIDEPISGLASIAFYEDGSFKISSYSSLPDKEKIVYLRQNEWPLLQDGSICDAGAYPLRWKRFEDEILRSYLAITNDEKNFAYVWTIFCPPSILAKTLQKWNFKDVILLDIHPVITALLASPTTKDTIFNRKTSYYFVPDEQGALKLLALANKIKRFRWDHYIPVEGGALPHDFFSVHKRK